MDAANALISALAGEEVRWTQQSMQFDDTISRLIGDCAIASRWGWGFDPTPWAGWAG
jgi:dynein heavy chain